MCDSVDGDRNMLVVIPFLFGEGEEGTDALVYHDSAPAKSPFLKEALPYSL